MIRRLLSILALVPVLLFAQSRSSQNMQLQKFNQFYNYLNGTYVDTINNAKLVEDAIKKVLSELDPHSAYIPAEEMKQVQESFDGSFSGIGVEYNILNDTIFIVNTVAGGPSEKVGVMPNDRIVKVDGKSVVGAKQTDVPKLLRGPKGSRVEIEVIRKGARTPLDFNITRDNIPLNTVDASYVTEGNIGYIKVNRFANTTMQEFREAYSKMGRIEGLIVDLRGNGGGLLGEAIDMSNFFLPQGSVIVSTEGRLAKAERHMATDNGVYTNGKLVVLIDEGSASGSEIVSGAIQDWDRGMIIGRQSFGKGLVQRQIPLIDGSTVRITVARYHTPAGRVIQRPFENGKRDEYYSALVKRINNPEQDTIPIADSLKYKTLRKGRTVYGGGGITPDIYVAADTTGYSEYWSSLIRRGVFAQFINDYLDKNRSKLEKRFSSFEKFNGNFEITPDILAELTSLGEKEGIPLNQEGMDRSAKDISIQLKALIAQRLWGMTAYYKVINSERDPIMDRAVKTIKNWNTEAAGIN